MSNRRQGFTIRVIDTKDGLVRVRPRGEVDLATAPALARTLEEQISAGNNVVLDLSGVEFMDSTGLSTILRAVQISGDGRGSLRLSSILSTQVQRLVELTGVQSALPVCGD